jgi:coenzyme F420-dependent glucose-6-phosphate dehydrogenase
LSRVRLSIDLGENYDDPIRFVECAAIADKYGFDTVWFGDHLMPWHHGGRKSAFVWSMMPTALDRTRNISVGPDVTCPIGGRYHPAIIAQAAATIDNMYPGRFRLAVGSGEAMNEAPFFPGGWPTWAERIERLAEAVVLVRKMWESAEYFTFEGKYFRMNNFFLYTKPKTRIPIYFSAIGEKAARYAGVYGDHLVTTINSPRRCRDLIFPAFESSARKAGRDPATMEKMVYVDLFFGDKQRGVQGIKASGEAGVLAQGAFDEPDPRRIEEMSRHVSDDKILENKFICSSADEVIEYVERYRKAGATHINLATGCSPDRIKMLGVKVLPYFA